METAAATNVLLNLAGNALSIKLTLRLPLTFTQNAQTSILAISE